MSGGEWCKGLGQESASVKRLLVEVVYRHRLRSSVWPAHFPWHNLHQFPNS